MQEVIRCCRASGGGLTGFFRNKKPSCFDKRSMTVSKLFSLCSTGVLLLLRSKDDDKFLAKLLALIGNGNKQNRADAETHPGNRSQTSRLGLSECHYLSGFSRQGE